MMAGGKIDILGTTSAHAENTNITLAIINIIRNYLRARGEYWIDGMDSGFDEELPPRTRRILKTWFELGFCLGTTSACAENTEPRKVLASC